MDGKQHPQNTVVQSLPHNIKARIREKYGVNRVIEGAYDRSIAAKCENGTFVGKREGELLRFLGIPFAKPPVGKQRWKRPVPVTPDHQVYEAYYNGKTPIQTEWPSEQASYYPQGEDCLYLNIWCSEDCLKKSLRKKNRPVMVFFHGGSYGWGGTADPLYDGARFVESQPDIILVTVGYRTGLMGFVDLSQLEGGEDFPDAPNLGIFDQIEALRWIQRNIASFGGDPANVTIFGESAGGGSVSLLPVIKEAKGLFKRAIAESGSVALTFSKEECREFTRRLIKESGTRRMSDLMAFSEELLMVINEKLNMYNNFPQRDGKLIPYDLYQPYFDGTTKDVELLMGTNSNEMNYWIGEIGGIVPFRFSIPVKFENDMRLLKREDKKRVKQFMSLHKGHSMWRMAEFYNELMFRLPAIRQAEGHSRNGGKTYMYYWTEPSTIRFRGACHAVELSYVFGNTDQTIYTGAPADEELSAKVRQMWTNFARTGDPSIDGLQWPQYSAAKRDTLVIAKEPRVRRDVLKNQRMLLYPLLRYRINPSYATLDYNVPFVRKSAAIGIAAAATVTAAVGIVIKNVINKK